MIEQNNEDFLTSEDMEIDYEWEESKRRRAAARRARMEAQRRKRERQLLIGTSFIVGVVLLVILIIGVKSCVGKTLKESENLESGEEFAATQMSNADETQSEAPGSGGLLPGESVGTAAEANTQPLPQAQAIQYSFTEAPVVGNIPEEVVSKYAILIDCETNQIIAGKDMYTRMIPASMIKVLTVLTAYDYVENMDDTTEITIDVTDYSFVNDCSNVGYGIGDRATIKDLFYGTILPSGADAAIALAKYCAGGKWEDFVPLMNQKIEELGLKNTHVTNCVGIHEEDHYSTAYDMAVILRTAMDNPFLKEVLSAHTYNTSPTKDHPEGILISNWYLRRIEDKDCHGLVVGGKTGYVDASGSCCASFAEDKNGKLYILVTASSTTSWRCINDHVAIFQKYFEE